MDALAPATGVRFVGLVGAAVMASWRCGAACGNHVGLVLRMTPREGCPTLNTHEHSVSQRESLPQHLHTKQKAWPHGLGSRLHLRKGLHLSDSSFSIRDGTDIESKQNPHKYKNPSVRHPCCNITSSTAEGATSDERRSDRATERTERQSDGATERTERRPTSESERTQRG